MPAPDVAALCALARSGGADVRERVEALGYGVVFVGPYGALEVTLRAPVSRDTLVEAWGASTTHWTMHGEPREQFTVEGPPCSVFVAFTSAGTTDRVAVRDDRPPP